MVSPHAKSPAGESSAEHLCKTSRIRPQSFGAVLVLVAKYLEGFPNGISGYQLFGEGQYPDIPSQWSYDDIKIRGQSGICLPAHPFRV